MTANASTIRSSSVSPSAYRALNSSVCALQLLVGHARGSPRRAARPGWRSTSSLRRIRVSPARMIRSNTATWPVYGDARRALLGCGSQPFGEGLRLPAETHPAATDPQRRPPFPPRRACAPASPPGGCCAREARAGPNRPSRALRDRRRPPPIPPAHPERPRPKPEPRPAPRRSGSASAGSGATVRPGARSSSCIGNSWNWVARNTVAGSLPSSARASCSRLPM